MIRRTALAPLLVGAALAAPAAAQELTEERVKDLALEAILENPEVVMEAVAILQQREAAAEEAARAEAVSDLSDDLFGGEDAPVLGNPDGDVTVVEFYDYNCGFCRRVAPTVEALIAADPQVRVVMREFPILSEESVAAARVSLAAMGQDGWTEMHKALMDGGRADAAAAMAAAEEAGMDLDAIEAALAGGAADEHIERSRALADALGIGGTPAFVIGDRVIPGAVPLEELEEAVANAREG
ncbi:protein-disulfide isomerase [Hasllibacter halocynthiae]|uniref:Protein-disulfide isomerase n=1 Tax=Hasllibacter halocynthiae TaxID=595589 RepID=A0A2T0X9F4_9RHOB|nr:DsbA family protein [Hasllibacter halocynthiae]PRY95582.1 protein-disulfide isomerase [Hasllibacter halocynthiae]